MSTVIALHGFAGAPSVWRRILARASRPFEAVYLPLVGHGAAPSGRGFTDEVRRLWALVDEVTTGSVEIFGYSLGARLGLAMALDRPDRVDRAVLVGVHPGLESPAEQEARRASDAVWQALLRAEGVTAFADAWQAQPLFATQARLDEALLAEQRRERITHDAEGLATSLEHTGLGVMPAFWDDLAGLTVPVDLVVGALDPKFLALAARAERALPRGRLTVVPGSGHNVLLEAPEAVAAVIDAPWPTERS